MAVTDLVAHAELEAYSVLTRLPAPFRADPPFAAEYLRERRASAVYERVGARFRMIA